MVDTTCSSPAFGAQHFTARQWSAAGGSRTDLKRLVASRQVRSPLHGVYVDAQVADTVDARMAALALVMPEGAAIARITAA